MPLSPDETRNRRRNAAGKLVAGGALIGAGTLAQSEVKRRTGINSPVHLVRDASKHGLKPRHGKYVAGWLGTRGIAATGVPLAVVGARNLIARKPQTADPLSIRNDVVDPMVGRTTGGVVGKKPVRKQSSVSKDAAVILPKREQQAQIHRKHKAASLGMASAGIGVTALGLRAPAAVKYAAGKSKRLAAIKPVQRVASWEAKATPASWNVGVLGTGVGSAAALNAARMQRADLRAEEGKVKKAQRQQRLHSDPELNRHMNARLRVSVAQGRKQGWDQGQTFEHWANSVNQRKWSAAYKRQRGHEKDYEPWPKDMPWTESVGDADGSEEGWHAIGRGLRKKPKERPVSRRDLNRSEKNTTWRDHVSDKAKAAYDSGRLNDEQMRKIRARGHQRSRFSKEDDMLRISGQRTRSEEVAKALFPKFSIKPPKFGGIKTGGLRRVQTPTGLKTITYRGSMG